MGYDIVVPSSSLPKHFLFKCGHPTFRVRRCIGEAVRPGFVSTPWFAMIRERGCRAQVPAHKENPQRTLFPRDSEAMAMKVGIR